MSERLTVASVDLGSSEIRAAIGQLTEDNQIVLMGFGSVPSQGIRRGIIVNLEEVVTCIKNAVHQAELMSKTRVESLYINVSGAHIRGVNSRGMTTVSNRELEIRRGDMNRAISAARAVSFPMDRDVIYVFPQEFIVDGQKGIESPVGMIGVRLEAEVHILTAATTAIQNITRSVDRAGFDTTQVMFGPVASSQILLRPEERDLGVLFMDIGAATTDIVVYSGGNLRYSGSVPKGGDMISHDLALTYGISKEEADKVKKTKGCAFSAFVNGSETVTLMKDDGRSISVPRSQLGQIIEPRLEQIFINVLDEIKKANVDRLINAGVVLTGGTSLLEGCIEFAEQFFNMNSRRGVARDVFGLEELARDPSHSVAVGLVAFGIRSQRVHNGVLPPTNWLARLVNRVAELFSWLGERV